jgi:hypothetical protein
VSNKGCHVMRVQPWGNNQGRVIIDCFTDIPAFPREITDDADNTYTLQSEDNEKEICTWYTVQKKVPTCTTMSWLYPEQDDVRFV